MQRSGRGRRYRRASRQVFILNFHGIGSPKRALPAGEQRVWLELGSFQAILDFLQTRNDVELTFDDANESDFDLALPALISRGLKARFFLVADRIDKAGFLSVSQVRELLHSGMEFGSHGLYHRPWADLDSRELHEELITARDRLEQCTGGRIEYASCPFGSYNRCVLRALRHAGYKAICTSDGGPAVRGSWLLPRNTVYRSHTLDTVHETVLGTNGPFRCLWRELKLAIKRLR